MKETRHTRLTRLSQTIQGEKTVESLAEQVAILIDMVAEMEREITRLKGLIRPENQDEDWDYLEK